MTRISRQNSIAAAVVWFLAATVALALAGCSEPAGDSEAELRQWVADGVAAAEAKERRKLVGMISENYVDARENDRETIGNRLRLIFFRMNSVTLLTAIDDIRVFDDSIAEIDLTVGMGGKNSNVFGFSADAYRFELELERDDGDWVLISARWGELGSELR